MIRILIDFRAIVTVFSPLEVNCTNFHLFQVLTFGGNMISIQGTGKVLCKTIQFLLFNNYIFRQSSLLFW